MSKFLLYTLIIFNALTTVAVADHVRLVGRVIDASATVKGKGLQGATIRDSNYGASVRGTISRKDGWFELTVPSLPTTLVVTMLGYDSLIVRVTTTDTLELRLDVPEYILAEGVVVTASRMEQRRQDAPVIVTTTTSAMIDAVQAVNLAEGLRFQPGLRLETNCQNCGFTQVRLNGLQGPYTQILIDSRPIFSSLNGVYGLEQIPAAMIDRIEVVRGAGSALYGAGAVAGTINVITREPSATSLSVSTTSQWYGGRVPDRVVSADGSFLSADGSSGLSVFATSRDRHAWDRNGDGFSETTAIRGAAGGGRGLIRFSETDRLGVDVFWLREFRRGGEMTWAAPHESTIAEQLDHSVAGASLTFESSFDDDNVRLSSYLSGQRTQRHSYYGGIGPVHDSTSRDLATRMYGNTNDYIGVAGVQVALRQSWFVPTLLVAGSELTINDVADNIFGSSRRIAQRITTSGTYVQAQFAPSAPFSMTVGGRFDVQNIVGSYTYGTRSPQLSDTTFVVVNPRLSAKLNINDVDILRLSYASGFRGPQAFDEDLHLSTLEGRPRSIRIPEGLRPERSHSLTLSYDHTDGTVTTATGWTVDLFATALTNPFVTSLTGDSSSRLRYAVKRNGDGAWVAGVNTEFRYAIAEKIEMTAGVTVQLARYMHREEVATSESTSLFSDVLLRTPNVYGSAMVTWKPLSGVSLDASWITTGAMSAVNERTMTLHRTSVFHDVSARVTGTLRISDILLLRLGMGIRNIFDAYQADLEWGVSRDAAFIYGPPMPRTLLFTISTTFDR